MSPESEALLRMLADGQWRDLDETLRRVEVTIAPGKALRRYDTKEAARVRRTGSERKTPELSDDDKIASGRRTLANVAVNALKIRHVEIRELASGRRQVRLRPKAAGPDLAALVAERFGEHEEGASAEPLPASLRRREKPSGEVCNWCGLWVVNPVQHEEFHRLTEPPSGGFQPDDEPPADVAFFNGAQIRALVRAELEAALDGFQAGLEEWMAKQFADLEGVLRHKLNQVIKRPRR